MWDKQNYMICPLWHSQHFLSGVGVRMPRGGECRPVSELDWPFSHGGQKSCQGEWTNVKKLFTIESLHLIAVSCIHGTPERRPCAKEVTEKLQNLLN